MGRKTKWEIPKHMRHDGSYEKMLGRSERLSNAAIAISIINIAVNILLAL